MVDLRVNWRMVGGSRYTKPIVRTVLINNSIRERAENHGGELGQQVRSNGSQLFESCP